MADFEIKGLGGDVESIIVAMVEKGVKFKAAIDLETEEWIITGNYQKGEDYAPSNPFDTNPNKPEEEEESGGLPGFGK
jgi:hypothetical protein